MTTDTKIKGNQYFADYKECGLSDQVAKKLTMLRLLCNTRQIKGLYSYSSIENMLLPFTESFGHKNKADSEFCIDFISSIQPLYNI